MLLVFVTSHIVFVNEGSFLLRNIFGAEKHIATIVLYNVSAFLLTTIRQQAICLSVGIYQIDCNVPFYWREK